MSSAISATTANPQGKAYGLLFGVEKYDDKGIGPVTYSELDATKVGEALLAVGYALADVKVIINEKATKTRIEYEITELASKATKADTLFIFFAGHGYTYGGENFLVAHDSQCGNIPKTAVSLRAMFESCQISLSRQVMFFLDCCHSGMKVADEGRDILETMSHEELKHYFSTAEFCAVFSSCGKGEKSYPSHDYKHGYWTYHLLRALRGEEPDVLDKAAHLRSTDLQNYLRLEVPKQVALKGSGTRSQTPTMYGDVSGTFVVADLSSVLAKAKVDSQLTTFGLKYTTLRGSESNSIRRLNGFNKKLHNVPNSHSKATQNWIPQIAEGDLTSEMEQYFQTIQKTKLYDNKSLQYDAPAEGSSAIRTPDFEFSITYSQSNDDPGKYEVVRELLRLNTPALLAEDWFNDLFDKVFDEAVFEFNHKINMNTFIEKAEKIPKLTLDYNGKRDKCTIRINNSKDTIIVTHKSLIYKFYSASTPREMALKLQESRTLLLNIPEIQKALPL